MPPKKTSAAKKDPKKVNVDFENHKNDFVDEAEEREAQMREFIKESEEKMFQELCAAIQALDPTILNMTVGQFMSMPVATEEDTKENEATTRGMREMTVENGGRKQQAGDLAQTAIRPQKDRRGLELRTPAGATFKCPSLITPRVGGGSLLTRAIRNDEIAFSAAGSPVVINAPESALDKIHQLVNADVTSLSPNTRAIVTSLREVMQRNMGSPV